jgi:outer membrane immunogenic protein
MPAQSHFARIAVAMAGATMLSVAAASAADLPAKLPVKAPPAALWNWTGFYLGAYAGAGVQRSRGNDPTGATTGGEVEYIGSGFSGGGTAGYNYQLYPKWVVGLEGDLGYLGLDRQFTDYYPDQNFNSKTSWMATLRGRVGYTDGPTLSYLTGGAAWVHFTDVNDGTAHGHDLISSSKTNGGFAYGTGVETRLGGNWTAKAEYLQIDVGHGDLLTSAHAYAPIKVDKHRYQIMKYGVNYLFGDRPNTPLPQRDWNGAYAGVVGGSAVTSTHGSDPSGAVAGDINNNGDGYTLGGIVGYNWQFAPHWVAGVEGDFSWFGIGHNSADYWDNPGTLDVKTSWLATARGRIGYSTGPALLYVTGGAAWVNLRDSFQASPFLIAGSGPLVSSEKTLSGPAVGGGIETPFFFPGWTSRTEYLFVSVGKGNTLNSAGDLLQADHRFHLFRTALVYRFWDAAAR